MSHFGAPHLQLSVLLLSTLFTAAGTFAAPTSARASPGGSNCSASRPAAFGPPAGVWPFSPPARKDGPDSGKRKVIVVDPGHGGVDGGAFANRVMEKEITLDISRKIGRDLSRLGFEVQMTRDSDTDLSGRYPSHLQGRHRKDLQNRLTFVRQAQAVGVLSVHANSSANPSDRGPIVFYSVNSEAGKALAMAVSAAVNEVAGSTQRPVGRKNLFLIRHSPCPAVLIEVGFLTHPGDAARLQTESYRSRLAEAIARSAAASLRNAPAAPPFVPRDGQSDWTPP